jgi:multidrug efflux system membrane fusion protein
MGYRAITPAALFVSLLVLLFAPAACLAQMGPTAVTVAPVQKRQVALTQPLVASVEPVTKTTLAAEQGGLVAERLFDEGQVVQAGQVLIKMKTDLLEAELATAEAARVSAEATVTRSQAQLENAANKLARMVRISETAASGEELRDAATEEKVRKADVAVQKATLNEKAAAVARLKLMIDKLQVKAPVAGMVARRHVEVGQWVKQGDPVADLVKLDPLWVKVMVPESVIARVQPGDEAPVAIDALKGRKFTAVVDQVLPEADPLSRTFAVKLVVKNPEGRVRPGFFARATLMGRSDAELVVPKDAVVPRGTDAHVIAARAGKAVVVPVTRGPGEGDTVAVTPLKPGDLTDQDVVVIRGNEQIRGGEPLIILGPPAVPGPTTAPATGPATAPSLAGNGRDGN